MNAEKILEIPDYLIVLRAVRLCGEAELSMREFAVMLRITEPYMVELKKALEAKDWIYVKKGDGKKKFIRLTDKGTDVADNIIKLFTSMEITDENIAEYRSKQKRKKEVKTDENKGEVC